MSLRYIPYSILAGLCGALGGLSSKIAFGGNFEKLYNPFFWCALTFFIFFNVMMWWAYSRSLMASTDTIKPMVMNMGVNFSVTGIAGALFFGEVHSLMWWTGLVTVILGISVLSTQQKEDKLRIE